MYSILPVGPIAPTFDLLETFDEYAGYTRSGSVLVSFDGGFPVDAVFPLQADNPQYAVGEYEAGEVVFVEGIPFVAITGGTASGTPSWPNLVSHFPHAAVVTGDVEWMPYCGINAGLGIATMYASRAHLTPDLFWYGYIRTAWETSQISLGDMMTEKRLDGAEVGYEVTAPALLGVQIYPPFTASHAYPGEAHTLKAPFDVDSEPSMMLDSPLGAGSIVAGYRHIGKDYLAGSLASRKSYRYQVMRVQETEHVSWYIDDSCRYFIPRALIQPFVGAPVIESTVLDLFDELAGPGWFSSFAVVTAIKTLVDGWLAPLRVWESVEPRIGITANDATYLRLRIVTSTDYAGSDYYVAAHPLWMSEEFENESPDGWATYGSSAMKLGTLFGCAPDLQGYTAASSEGSPASNTPERNFLRVIQPVQLNWLGVQLQLETFNRRRMP
jgi:hypothetical protein